MIEPRCLSQGKLGRLCFRAASSATENGFVAPGCIRTMRGEGANCGLRAHAGGFACLKETAAAGGTEAEFLGAMPGQSRHDRRTCQPENRSAGNPEGRLTVNRRKFQNTLP
jgi:hypothetical protein